MIQGIKVFVYPVKNLDQATSFYKKMLGVDPYATSPYYVGFRVGELEIGLDPNGHQKGLAGPICYWQVKDIAQALKTFESAGAKVHEPVKDVGGGTLTAAAKDADGNITWLVQR